MRFTEKKLLEMFVKIKSDRKLVYYDTHIHPSDVFGLCDHSAHAHNGPSLLERLEYSDSVLEILRLLFLYFPRYIKSEIRKKFPYQNEQQLLEEMQRAYIDHGVIVPIPPHATPQKIYANFGSKKFVRLGSIDIHSLSEDDIENEIQSQIQTYQIVGIKLHPNIQSFYPEPSLNDNILRGKLEKIYRIAEKNRLYILIHGGLSYVPTAFDSREKFEKRQFGLLQNFFAENGHTFISELHIPIIIAHLGLYNVINAQFDEIDILSKFSNVYFDTAGISPKLIQRYITKNGIDRLVFGSDAPYFDLRYNIYLVLKAVSSCNKIDFAEAVSKIFSLNYNKILREIGKTS